MIELTAPAGSFECLHAAIKAGADSIYFGVSHLNMRSGSANNFELKDIKKIAGICHENKVKCFLALNTILYDSDMQKMKEIIDVAKEADVDAIIASDMAAILYCRKLSMPVHISTLMSVSNIEGVKFFSQYADRIVLARELSLNQIKNICNEIKKQNIKSPSGKLIDIEIFCHGALCVAVSGRCNMSLFQYNSSAKRGACLQSCRRAYKVTDIETGKELVVDNYYVMSPEDLCTIGFLDKIADAGVNVLKIEGRARKADYVYTAAKAYREAIDSIQNNAYTKEKIKQWKKELSKVYNRGLSDGYYLGKKIGSWSKAHGNKSKYEKVYLGKVRNYYKKSKIAEVFLESGDAAEGEEILITGPTTGIVKDKVMELKKHNNIITFPLNELVRKNDKFFVFRKRKQS